MVKKRQKPTTDAGYALQHRREKYENLSFYNLLEILIGDPITPPQRGSTNPELIRLKNQVELDRVRFEGPEFERRINNVLYTTKEENKGVGKLEKLNKWFDTVVPRNAPGLYRLYELIRKRIHKKHFQIDFGHINIHTQHPVEKTYHTNESFYSNLRGIMLGYFLRIPYKVVHSVNDSAGYLVPDDIEHFRAKPDYINIYYYGEKPYSYAGKLFPYINDTGLDLKRYQIFEKPQDMEGQKPCFINCLTTSLGFEEVNKHKSELLKIMKTYGDGVEVPTDCLSKVAELYKVQFELCKPNRRFKNRGEYLLSTIASNKTRYPKECEEGRKKIKLSLFENHYILHENYADNNTNFQEVKRKVQCVNKNSTSTWLICSLFNNGKFKEKINTVNLMSEYYKDIDTLEFLESENIHNKEQRPFEKISLEVIQSKMIKNFRRKKKSYLDECSDPIKFFYALPRSGNNNINYSNKKVDAIPINNYYCDCEAGFVEKEHIPWSIGKTDQYIEHNDPSKHVELFINDANDYTNAQFINDFLMSFNTKEVNILNFHNAKYDYSLLLSIGLGKIINTCKKDGMFYSVEFVYNDRFFIMVDTYKKIPKKLSDAGNMFNCKSRKIEHTLYDLYTMEALKKPHLEFKEIEFKDIEAGHLKYICDEKGAKKVSKLPETYEYIIIDDRAVINQQFLDVTDKSYIEGNYFKHKEYYNYYLRLDCLVLKEVMHAYDELMKEILGETYYFKDSLTISSIADNYACALGAYDGVYELQGQSLNFCKKASRGGRVCTAYNKVINTFVDKENEDIKIEDFDATSLYPSAIALCKLIFGGMPAGAAKKFTKEEIEELNSCDDIIGKLAFLSEDTNAEGVKVIKKKYSVCRVKILSVKKQRAIPVFSLHDNTAIDWTSNIEGKVMILDWFTLHDGVVHQGLKFEIIEGCYWSKFNPILCNIVERIFLKRKEMTKLRDEEKDKVDKDLDKIAKYNALSELLKLFLNSLYGKNGLKRSEKISRVMDWDEKNDYVTKNYDKLQPSEGPILKNINGERYYQIESCNHSEHWNRQHISMMILGCSKYIMNKFTCLAEDIGLELYYTDTDSLHVCTESEKYKGKIIYEGEDMQYSEENNGAKILREVYIKKYKVDPIGGNLGQFKSDFKMSDEDVINIYSTGIIALGKKMYCHKLKGYNKKTGKIVYEASGALKGFPEKALQAFAEEKYKGDKLELYQRVYDGEVLKIDITAGNTLPSFKIGEGKIEHNGEFNRTLCIVNEKLYDEINKDYNDGLSKEELSEKYNMDKKDLKKYLNK
jgi:hypothetical protein